MIQSTDSQPQVAETINRLAATPRELAAAFVAGDDHLIQRIDEIADFKMRVVLQPLMGLRNVENRRRLVPRGFEILNEILTETGIHHHELLRVSMDEDEDEKSEVRYALEQPALQFATSVSHSHFGIDREASSLASFLEWYFTVMPAANRMYSLFRKELQQVTDELVTPVETSFAFTFKLTDFRKPGQARASRNLAVLKSLVPTVPNASGERQSIDEQNFYRVDVNISRRSVVGGKVRNTWYTVQAPWNDRGKGIEFRASLVSHTMPEILADGEPGAIVGFDPDSLGDHNIAVREFLKDEALGKFLQSVVGDWDFKTVRTF